MTGIVQDLRSGRLLRGLTQRDVAEALSTTQSAIARLEAGALSPRLSTLEAYARALGLGTVTIVDDPVGRMAAAVADCHERGDVESGLRVVIQFLDDTREVEPEVLARQLRSEPARTGRRAWDAMIAAAVAWRARQNGVEVPGWTAAPWRYLDGPWFPVSELLGRPPSLALAAHLWAAAPADFVGRGVIIDGDSLRSV